MPFKLAQVPPGSAFWVRLPDYGPSPVRGRVVRVMDAGPVDVVIYSSSAPGGWRLAQLDRGLEVETESEDSY